MVATLIGIKRIEFEDSKTGAKISGRRLYLTYDDDTLTGTGCADKYFPDDSDVVLPPDLVVGRSYEFVYKEQGFSGKSKLIAINPVK